MTTGDIGASAGGHGRLFGKLLRALGFRWVFPIGTMPIPYHPLLDPAVTNNPYILLIDPERGGHVAFLSASAGADPDLFWAENRVVEFCRLANETV